MPEIDPSQQLFLPNQWAEDFVETLKTDQTFAKDTIALAQDQQVKAYDKNTGLYRQWKKETMLILTCTP